MQNELTAIWQFQAMWPPTIAIFACSFQFLVINTDTLVIKDLTGMKDWPPVIEDADNLSLLK